MALKSKCNTVFNNYIINSKNDILVNKTNYLAQV